MTSTADNEIKSDMTKTGIEAGEKYKKKRPSLNFERMGIPSGSILEFNDDEITAEALVTSARRVSMRMLIFSLTGLTRELLQLDYSEQPTRYWQYGGKESSGYLQ